MVSIKQEMKPTLVSTNGSGSRDTQQLIEKPFLLVAAGLSRLHGYLNSLCLRSTQLTLLLLLLIARIRAHHLLISL